MRKIQREFIQTWFVTGAYSGVGLELCYQLLERGYQVVACSRRKPVFQHPRALNLTLDVTDPNAVDQAIEAAISHFGRVDVLCNNAGICTKCTIEEESLERMKREMEVNFFGTFNMIHAILPHFRRQGHGTIVTNSSSSGLLPCPYGAAYSSSKYAVEGLTDMARSETAAFCRTMAFEMGAFWGTDISTMASTRINDTGIAEYENSRRLYPFKKNYINVLSIAMGMLIDAVEAEEMPAHVLLGSIEAAENRAFELKRDAALARRLYTGCSLSPAALWRKERAQVYPRHVPPVHTGIMPLTKYEGNAAEDSLALFSLYRGVESMGGKPTLVNYTNGLPYYCPVQENTLLQRMACICTKPYGHWHTLNKELNACRNLLVWQRRPMQRDEALLHTFFASEGYTVHLLKGEQETERSSDDNAWDSMTMCTAAEAVCLLRAEEWTAALPPSSAHRAGDVCVLCLGAESSVPVQALPSGLSVEILQPGDDPDTWLRVLSTAAAIVTDSSVAVSLALLWHKPFLYVGQEAATVHLLNEVGESQRVCLPEIPETALGLLQGPVPESAAEQATQMLRKRAYLGLQKAMRPANTDSVARRQTHLRTLNRYVAGVWRHMLRECVKLYVFRLCACVTSRERKERLLHKCSQTKQRMRAARYWLWGDA